jgi:hypothetical protein
VINSALYTKSQDKSKRENNVKECHKLNYLLNKFDAVMSGRLNLEWMGWNEYGMFEITLWISEITLWISENPNFRSH